jgi:hypothetical protein
MEIKCPDCGGIDISLDGYELLSQEKAHKELACLYKCRGCWYSFREVYYYTRKKELGALQSEIKYSLIQQQASNRSRFGALVKWYPVGSFDGSGRVVWDGKKLDKLLSGINGDRVA